MTIFELYAVRVVFSASCVQCELCSVRVVFSATCVQCELYHRVRQ